VRYLNLLASVLIQLCLGGIYAWSEFVPGLTGSYGVGVAQTQLVFGVSIAAFTGAMVWSARLVERRGPRLVATIGGVVFGLGYLTASLSGGSFLVLLLGIGVLAGIGTGFGYACPLPTCMRWFPEHRGLVTGIAVAGFGGGAVILALMAELLMARGLDVLVVFRWVGVAYGIVILAAAQALRFPAPQASRQARSTSRIGVLRRDPFFIGLAIGLFSGTFAGLMVVGSLKPLGLWAGLSPAWATWSIGVFSAGNVVGRIAWGRVADRLGRRSVVSSLAFLALSLALLALAALAWPMAMVGASFLVGCGFGACFVVYAVQTASRYGDDSFGRVYPLVFLAYGAAAIAGPWIGGWIYNASAGYSTALWLSVAVVVVGMISSLGLLRRGAAST
jgi:OFA family oxalate/formate antiporter-like MFS transporter